ncbi:MAG TPA: ABC transporter permease [Actinomycetota bacterium]|nr:ABC transporter permease [Actinomycetota bacterium]
MSTRAESPFMNGSLEGVLSSGPKPQPASAPSAALTFAWRGILKIKHVPEQLFDVTLTPILFTVMFTYLFGGALAGSPREYLQFLLPAILVMTVLFTTVYSGMSLNTDVTKGVIDRIRSLPISRTAPLVGPLLSDSVRYLLASLVTLTVGLILGYRPDGGVFGVLAGLALLLVFAFGLSWVFMVVGLIMRTPNAVLNLSFATLFPVTFMTNSFVDPETMPGWVQAVVHNNPISHLVSAERALLAGNTPDDIWKVLLTAAALTVVFAPLTTRLYAKR